MTVALRAPDVVCIAASTGGPQAVGALLDAFASPPPCPVLIIQHLPGSFTGRFADRLARRSPFDIHEAESGAPLRAGEILVAPGDAHLRVKHRRVRLSHELPVAGLRPRADLTLADLATEYGEGTTAVVLSGMGSDGFEGGLAVVAAGGQVLAQDGPSCTVDGMPARIRTEGLATLVGPPAVLGAALDRAWNRSATAPAGGEHPRAHDVGPDASSPDERPGSRRPAAAAAPTAAVFAALRRLEDVDLRSFKAPPIQRNLTAFADQYGYDLDDLAVAVERSAELRRALLDRLTINVTTFFRDPQRWADVDHLVIPGLGPEPRVWNPGCADGSETCSLAMLLLESGRRPRIWATDVNAARIERARTGSYDDLAVVDVPEGPGDAVGPDGTGARDRLDRWFRRDGEAWVVADQIRASINYEHHEAIDGPLEGPVPGPFDLIVCRNLIIYLTPEARDRLLHRAADLLTAGGSLLLGSAERILRPDRYGFTRIAPGLYRRDQATAHP